MEVTQEFLNLGHAPPSNAYLTEEQLTQPEVHFPLRTYVCTACYLVQTNSELEADHLFTPTYAYFSGTSKYWIEHCRNYANEIQHLLALSAENLVIEIASNDGTLLQFFKDKKISCIGVEPTKSTAKVCEDRDIQTINDFFSAQLATHIIEKNGKADLVIGNNVLAHVPNIVDFTTGLCTLLKPEGTVTLEFPSLLALIKSSQFDTIYHEHYSYLSLLFVSKIFARSNLRIYKVELLPTHGGSYRVYGCLKNSKKKTEDSVVKTIQTEKDFGLSNPKRYIEFKAAVQKIQTDFLRFLVEAKKDGKSVYGFGAAAKANTLLNSIGIKSNLIGGIFDSAKAKQNLFMPGSHIPILDPSNISEFAPNFLIIFPWNIFQEIKDSYSHLGLKHGTKFVKTNPKIEIIE